MSKPKTKKITTIVFDFFGVIRRDGLIAWREENNLEEFVGTIRETDDARCIGKISRQDYLKVMSDISGQDPEDIRQRMHDLAVINPVMVELVEKLRANYRVALLTNSSDTTRPHIEQAGLDKLFELMVFSHEIGMIKPSREIYEYAIDKLNIRPEQAIFIDDKLENIEAARSVGMVGVVFESPEQLIAELSQHGAVV